MNISPLTMMLLLVAALVAGNILVPKQLVTADPC